MIPSHAPSSNDTETKIEDQNVLCRDINYTLGICGYGITVQELNAEGVIFTTKSAADVAGFIDELYQKQCFLPISVLPILFKNAEHANRMNTILRRLRENTGLATTRTLLDTLLEHATHSQIILAAITSNPRDKSAEVFDSTIRMLEEQKKQQMLALCMGITTKVGGSSSFFRVFSPHSCKQSSITDGHVLEIVKQFL